MAALLPTAAQRYNSVEIVSAPRQQNETNNKIRLVAFVALAGVFLLSSTLNSTHSSTSSLAVTQSSVTIGNSRPAVTTNSRQPKGPSPVRVNQAVNPVTGKLLAPKQAATLGRMSALPTASGDVRERLSPDMAPSTESTSQVGQGQWALAAFVMLLTAAAAFFMYGRSTPKYAMMAVEGEDVEVKVDKKTTPLTVEPVLDVNDGMSVEEVEAIQADSASALEVMYIDALWAYYSKDETNMLSNEDFDRLKMELNWQDEAQASQTPSSRSPCDNLRSTNPLHRIRDALRRGCFPPPNVGLQALLATQFCPSKLSIDGEEVPYQRFEIPVEIADPFVFLELQTLYPKVYFQHPRDGTRMGLGKALMLDHLPTFRGAEGPRFYGGGDFMPRGGDTWEGYPETTYFLPLVEIEKRPSGWVLCLNRLTDTVDVTLHNKGSLMQMEDAVVTSRDDSPSYPEWERNIDAVLHGIRERAYTKVVLARRTRFEVDRPVQPFALLRELEGATRYAFQFAGSSAFVGLSPETLYRREGGVVESAAVAGTRPRGRTEAEDQAMMEDLLTNPKEKHEFQVVCGMIRNIMEPLCHTITMQDEKVLKTPTVQHLYHTFQGILIEGTTDQALIRALHPTPAVGGMPRREALEEIARLEGFDRGWYAAPLGWVSPDEAHHLVGIRSALVEGREVWLFAGTGIVQGSVPEREWEELEHKIKQYLRVLQQRGLRPDHP